MKFSFSLLILAALMPGLALAQTGADQNAAPVLELQPLIITAPRLKLPPNAVLDPQIDMYLLQLLQKKKGERPDATAAADPNVAVLSQLTTLDGYNLQTRYTQLGFLLTEGLAGSTDMQIQNALQSAASKGNNVQIQAAAMVALAYTKDQQFLGIFQNALQNSNVSVRFGALEALEILGGASGQFSVSNAANSDSSLIVQVYAAAELWRMGDTSGQNLLMNLYLNQSWLIRAMAYHYLGELGGDYEYTMLLTQLPTENDPIAKAELIYALLRLSHFHASQ